MAKRPTLLEKAILAIDEKIAALQLARQHLVEQLADSRDSAGKRKPSATT